MKNFHETENIKNQITQFFESDYFLDKTLNPNN